MDFYKNPSDSGIFPKFYLRAVEDKQASLKKGRPIFKEVEWVDIHIAGDNKTVVSKKVVDEHRDRWPKAYQAFIDGKDSPIEGTPIDQWPSLSVSQAAELQAFNVHTVEALASLPDTAIQDLGMGARDLVAKAKAFINAASGNAELERLAVENEEMHKELDMLKEQIRELGARKNEG